MAKKSTNGKYQGSLSLEWFNKQKAILLLDENHPKKEGDVPAPRINWINRDDALFYEIGEEEGKGLTPYWVDRNDIRVKEARPLVFKKAYIAEARDKRGSLPGMDEEYKVKESTLDDPAIQNWLIKGDNLLALNMLKRHFDNLPDEKKVKCVFIDPPYNTGSAFDCYDDNMEHSEWLTMMRDRLVLLRGLIRSDGFICCQIDDSESAYLKVLLDEVFGRVNYLTTIFVQVRYKNKTLAEDNDYQKVIEQCLVYAKNAEFSQANKETEPYKVEKFEWEIAERADGVELVLGGKQVICFRPGEYSIKKVSAHVGALKETWATGSLVRQTGSSGEFLDKHIAPRKNIDGLGCLYKVAGIGEDGLGFRYMTGPKREDASKGRFYSGIPLKTLSDIKGGNSNKKKPIENFYDLSGSFGNCRTEGGVDFRGGKKPEKLLHLLFGFFSSEGDIILDAFSGSGGSAAVAHKMKRQWICVEIGKHADTHIISRLMRVLANEDKSGISDNVGWSGGGSFKYYHLGSSIIQVDPKTGKGEFNWKLGCKFLQESLLQSYDFVPEKTIAFHQYLGGDTPSIGRLSTSKGVILGVAWLVAPGEPDVSIDAETVQTLYNALKQHTPKSIHIFTNKGWDIKQDAMPTDMEIVKVPHAIFAELER